MAKTSKFDENYEPTDLKSRNLTNTWHKKNGENNTKAHHMLKTKDRENCKHSHRKKGMSTVFQNHPWSFPQDGEHPGVAFPNCYKHLN